MVVRKHDGHGVNEYGRTSSAPSGRTRSVISRVVETVEAAARVVIPGNPDIGATANRAGRRRQSRSAPNRQGLKVFLCHASEDKEKIRGLYRRLRKDGHRPWLDEEDIPPGAIWRDAIKAALAYCDIALVCCSSTSVSKSGVVQEEIRDILDLSRSRPFEHVSFIAVRFDECQIPRQLRDRQYADLFKRDGYARLRESLAAESKRLRFARRTSRR